MYIHIIYICVFVHGAYTYRRDKSNISIVRRADGVAGAEGGGEVNWEMRERTGRKERGRLEVGWGGEGGGNTHTFSSIEGIRVLN